MSLSSVLFLFFFFFFFFQAEDGIRDYKVTGVQTCALPIWKHGCYEDYGDEVEDFGDSNCRGIQPQVVVAQHLAEQQLVYSCLDEYCKAVDYQGPALV